MRLDARERLVIIGKTGTGKSNYAKDLCRELMRAGSRVVVFDVCDEYSIHGRKTPEVKLGPLTHRCTVDELVANQRAWLDRKSLALSVVPEGDPREIADDFLAVSEAVHTTGKMTFVIEETGYFGEHCEDRLKAVATIYRHFGVRAIFVAQRATQIPLTARSQASQLIAFRQDETTDLDALEKRVNEEFARKVSRLPPGKWEVWRDDLHSQPEKEV